MLLSPQFLSQLEQLALGSRHRLLGSLAGDHRSTRYGNTLDFADFREYHPGDDFRRIDYHVLARLDDLLIKLYEADDDLVIRILFDTSASMGMYGKFLQAKRLAAALGVIGLTTNDPVQLYTFPAQGPPRRFFGRTNAPLLLQTLEGLETAGDTPFARAAGDILARQGPPGLTIVISDLLTPEWRHAIGRLRARGSALVVAHLLAGEETNPQLIGDLELLDRETGTYVPISIDTELMRNYTERVAMWQTEIRQRCGSVGATYLPVSTDDDLERLLLTHWRSQGVLR